jgi:hypothetical protein
MMSHTILVPHGKIVEENLFYDQIGMLTQLGVM